jgi:hypothetical protein
VLCPLKEGTYNAVFLRLRLLRCELTIEILKVLLLGDIVLGKGFSGFLETKKSTPLLNGRRVKLFHSIDLYSGGIAAEIR